MLAEALAQLDFQSKGRLDVGIGRGTTPDTLRALEIDPSETRERYEAAYEILLQAWTNARASYAGKHWRFTSIPVGPRPVQQPYPPIYVAGTTRDTIEFAIERDLPLILASATERETLAAYRELSGRGHGELDLGAWIVSRYICVAPTRAEADALVDRGVDQLNLQKLRVRPADAPPAPPAYDPDTFRTRDCIYGTPEDCIEQIHKLHETWHVGQLRCFFNKAGTVDRRTERAMMELFAREVMPFCRQLESERSPVGTKP
jgi:alkanesulfonate monooxygenase SsuD/methylene tetrahydromethanopterin reductase-like flavin-dependent oxidoreductase (luciferase family)